MFKKWEKKNIKKKKEKKDRWPTSTQWVKIQDIVVGLFSNYFKIWMGAILVNFVRYDLT